MKSCCKKTCCNKKCRKTNLKKKIIFLGMAHLRGFLSRGHGFIEQPISAKANLGAGLNFFQKTSVLKTSNTLEKNDFAKVDRMVTCRGALR